MLISLIWVIRNVTLILCENAAYLEFIIAAPVPDVPEVIDIPDEEEEQVDDLDAEDDWFGFRMCVICHIL